MSIPYKVQLNSFEGPLDLLLHLIRKNDVDIYDIPITLILEQYMEYLDLAQELNVDLAGEFLLMAAELAYIKSRLLLPEDTAGEEGADEGPDPRSELVKRLLEYQKYKLAARTLYQAPLLGRDIFSRSVQEESGSEEDVLEVEQTALLLAFQNVLRRLPKERVHEVRVERISLSHRILELVDFLKDRERVRFSELFSSDRTRMQMVVTFLALLEMGKRQMAKLFQEEGVYGEIWVSPDVGVTQSLSNLEDEYEQREEHP